jgi:hypothetical protein
VYNFNITNADGCDSTATLNLTIDNEGERTVTVSACGTYSWYGQTYTQSGTYLHFVPGPLVCDSTITLDLNIVNLDTVVIVEGNQLTAAEQNANYQWYNCTNNQSIPGETGISFTAPESGSYGVKIDINGCIDTSECHAITISGIKDHNKSVQLYPNPTTGIITIELGDQFNEPRIWLNDITGRIIDVEINRYENSIEIDLSDVSHGIYIVNFKENDSFVQMKVVNN